MTPDGRDDATPVGTSAFLEDDDDDDDAANDAAHLSATFAAAPGFAASCCRAASIPALCASLRPFGAGPLIILPLDEGFEGALKDRHCRPCKAGA